MEIKVLIELFQNSLFSALFTVILAGIISYIVSLNVVKTQVKYAHVISRTIDMNYALMSLVDDLEAMMQIAKHVIKTEYDFGFDASQQTEFNKHSREIYEIVKKSNALSRIMDNIRELGKLGFEVFLKYHDVNSHQIYREYKITMLADYQDEIDKIGFTHKVLFSKNISGKSCYDVLTEIDIKTVQRFFKEQW